MSPTVRITEEGLGGLIENIKANGGDTGDLEDVMNEINGEKKQRQTPKRPQMTMPVEGEELTTEERLEQDVGVLFPEGITEELLAKCIEMDTTYTLVDLKEMCVEAGLSPGGHKKELAAKLIAKGIA